MPRKTLQVRSLCRPPAGYHVAMLVQAFTGSQPARSAHDHTALKASGPLHPVLPLDAHTTYGDEFDSPSCKRTAAFQPLKLRAKPHAEAPTAGIGSQHQAAAAAQGAHMKRYPWMPNPAKCEALTNIAKKHLLFRSLRFLQKASAVLKVRVAFDRPQCSAVHCVPGLERMSTHTAHCLTHCNVTMNAILCAGWPVTRCTAAAIAQRTHQCLVASRSQPGASVYRCQSRMAAPLTTSAPTHMTSCRMPLSLAWLYLPICKAQMVTSHPCAQHLCTTRLMCTT